MSKRGASPPPNSGVLIKKARQETAPPQNQIAISGSNNEREKALMRTVKRTSNLEAPIVQLSGAHSMEIMSCRFDPSGQNVAACSADRTVSFWKTYPPTTNYGILPALHKAAILDLQWSLVDQTLYTVSADKSLLMTDLKTASPVRRIRGAHRNIINALDRTLAAPGAELLATASDDSTVRVWDAGEDGGKLPVATLEVGSPVTAVSWSSDGAQIFAGALDNLIHVYDLRSQREVFVLEGHTDTPTSLALSPSGTSLLSPSLSSQTIIWDIRPFSPAPSRIQRVLQGAPAGFENTLSRGAWSRDDDGARVALGGADRTVTVWDADSGKIQYKLPGHKGTVTSVDFHPREPIVLTGSKDATMLMGELGA